MKGESDIKRSVTLNGDWSAFVLHNFGVDPLAIGRGGEIRILGPSTCDVLVQTSRQRSDR